MRKGDTLGGLATGDGKEVRVSGVGDGHDADAEETTSGRAERDVGALVACEERRGRTGRVRPANVTAERVEAGEDARWTAVRESMA